jgi:hypothetical protein
MLQSLDMFFFLLHAGVQALACRAGEHSRLKPVLQRTQEFIFAHYWTTSTQPPRRPGGDERLQRLAHASHRAQAWRAVYHL